MRYLVSGMMKVAAFGAEPATELCSLAIYIAGTPEEAIARCSAAYPDAFDLRADVIGGPEAERERRRMRRRRRKLMETLEYSTVYCPVIKFWQAFAFSR